jgi:HSP20 family molecular chaperone IbpA
VEDNQLQVRGKQKDEPGKDYLHRGIAARQFQRNFLLADGMEVKDANLGHGMLVIELERPRAAKIARKIDIRSL